MFLAGKHLLRGVMQRAWAVRRRLAVAAGMLGALLGTLPIPAGAQAASGEKRAAQSGSPTFQALAAKATAARDAERLDEAAGLFRKALALNPRWTEGWWSLGTLYYDSDRYAAAIGAFQKGLALDPKQGTARAMLGLSEFEMGQDANALRDIEASKSLGMIEDPQLREVVLYHEGVLLQRASRFEGAQKALDSLCQSGVASREVTLTLGMVVLRMRDRTAPADGSTNAEIVEHMGRGACLAAEKNYDEARKEYGVVLAASPHYPYAHYAYGRLLLEARDTASAIREFQEEIKEAPDNVLARLQIGAAEYKVNSAAGVPYAEEAVRLAPQLPFAHYLLGLLLLDTGEYEKAIPHLEIARKAFPQEARIDLSLAGAYAHTGRSQEAAQARAEFMRLSKVGEKEPENAGLGSTPAAGPQIEITDRMEGLRKH